MTHQPEGGGDTGGKVDKESDCNQCVKKIYLLVGRFLARLNMPPFEIVSDFKMTGDQPQAVDELVEKLNKRRDKK